MRISARHGHFVFGAMQSAVTSLVASGIASRAFWSSGEFLLKWLHSWLFSWMVVLPVVLLAAPLLRKAVAWMTREGSVNDLHARR
jgi:hypothetical protein